MLRIVPGGKRTPPSAGRRARPQVERLEGRDCPAAPTITLSIAARSDRNVTLTGTVTGDSPGSDTVIISGAMSGTVTPAADGTFSFATTADRLGDVTAVATNPDNETSDPAIVTLTSQAPQVSIDSLNYGTFRTVTVSGHVTDDESVGGLTVTLGGVAGGVTVKTDAGGNFVCTTSMLGLGQVIAMTNDVWGQASNVACAQVTSNPPQVDSTSVSYASYSWVTFTGHVQDESPNGITVRFGGMPEVQNKTATCDQNGNYSFTVQLHPGEAGQVQAVATDWWSLNSNPGFYVVQV
jgi:hypothetical protein